MMEVAFAATIIAKAGNSVFRNLHEANLGKIPDKPE